MEETFIYRKGLLFQARGAERRLPEMDLLLPIRHKGKILDMALFGRDSYIKNVSEMVQEYFHSENLPNITFIPATTAESVSAISLGFERFNNPLILRGGVQAGSMVATAEGIFVNPLNTKGEVITDEETLKSFLKKGSKVGDIYLWEKDGGFAPYESFKCGFQDCDSFAEGGLARVIEHTTEGRAEKLRAIASPKYYDKGVEVFGDIVLQNQFNLFRFLNLRRKSSLFGSNKLVVSLKNVYYKEGYAFGKAKENSEEIQIRGAVLNKNTEKLNSSEEPGC
jgi:hypothetical protein